MQLWLLISHCSHAVFANASIGNEWELRAHKGILGAWCECAAIRGQDAEATIQIKLLGLSFPRTPSAHVGDPEASEDTEGHRGTQSHHCVLGHS